MDSLLSVSQPIVSGLGAWAQIGVFAAKSGLVVFAIIVVILFAAIMAAKNSHKPELEITDLQERFRQYGIWLKSTILPADLFKQEQKKLKKKEKEESKSEEIKKQIYVIDFDGDTKADAVESLREEVTAILTVATPLDEVVIRLESPGGMVHAYGLAASQLVRVRQKNIPLTVCVDMVAASGGYLMSCVANKIIAAPFAIVGSIGVVAQVPNIHKFLKKHDIDYTEYTAGEYKRTVSIFGEITAKGEEKFKEQLESTHSLFKSFVGRYRPSLELGKVATGEYWYGEQAKDLGLIDEISTSDDYLLTLSENYRVHKISFVKHESLQDKIGEILGKSFESTLSKIIAKLETKKLF